MADILYSFIVPHHNNPELLNRLISTIPQRQDVEIVVVDDNSDDDKKPVSLRDDCRIFFIGPEETKGAGKARNLGMEKARGKWFLFADSDDIYEKDFIDTLDEFSSRDNLDILYYDVFYTWDLETKTERWPQRYSSAISNYLKSGNSKYWLLMVKHVIQGPWNFMIRAEYVKSINALYDEVPKGNDAYFHHYVAMNTDRCAVTDKKLYYWLWSDSGLTHQTRSKDYYLSSIKHSARLINMRVSAGAWDTIPAFYKGFSKVIKEHGMLFAGRYIGLKFFSGVPWLKIWLHQKFDRKE